MERDLRTPAWKEPEPFEGRLSEEQLDGLQKREIKIAMMLSQLSQAGDFTIGWVRMLVENQRRTEEELAQINAKCAAYELEMDRLRSKVLVGQWAMGIVASAVLLEIVKKWFGK